MIISHKHRFIFIKTAKTAGTSIEIALSKFAGHHDVITPCTPADEALRLELGHVGPQNYKLPLRKDPFGGFVRMLVTRTRPAFYNHIDAATIRQFVGATIWSSYFKFCFERNPWDKVVSAYYFDRADSAAKSLSDYVQSGAASNIPGYNIYTIRGEIAVNKVYLYEDLPNAISDLGSRLGLSEPIVLPRAKGHFRPDNTLYRSVLTNADREKIARVYAREIATFGYSW